MTQSTFPAFENQRGFVLPVVLFGLVIMSTLAVAAMLNSSDEFLSSRAMRTSRAAFYAAEAGLHEIYATWDTWQPAIDSLAPGDSLDMGWRTLDNGASYRGVLQRWDNGGQPMYRVAVEGRSVGSAGAQKTLSLSLTSALGSGLKVGECCDGAATVRGEVALDDESSINGYDQHPPGWGSAGVCSDDLDDQAGLIMEDTSELNIDDDESTIDGDPPLVEMPLMNDSTFNYFNGLTWDSLRAMAEFEIGTPGVRTDLLPSMIYPRYNADGSCDTSHLYNWGSDDPDDACFDHFPIVAIYGDVNFMDEAYGQALLLVDTATFVNEDGDTIVGGSEIDFEDDTRFNGVVLGKGCVEIQRGAVFHGGIFVDGDHWTGGVEGMGTLLCEPDAPLDLSDDATLQWSQCAVDRAILGAGLTEFGEANAGGAKMLVSRSFGEMF